MKFLIALLILPMFVVSQSANSTLGSPVVKNKSETWVENVNLHSDLIIEPGVTLTIKKEVYVNPAAKIIVKRGGTLIVDGGKITSACGELWKGVEVWGTTSQSQNTTYQGIVIVKNGATIENAEYGVRAIKATENAQGEILDYGYTGGIVYGMGANFINNKIAAKFYRYTTYTSISFFRNCDFVTDNGLFPGFSVKNFAELNDIRGVTFGGCTFKDMRSGIAPLNLFSGIETNNARIYVNKYNNESCLFMNLLYGVKANANITANTVNIENCIFSNNLRSVYLNGVTNATVILNSFDPWTGTSPGIVNYCLYLDYCTGYKVEENNFINKLDDPKGIGLVINNSGTNNNMIYNNFFKNLEYSTLAQNNNRGLIETQGLQIKCNDYELNNCDIAVTATDIPLPGIAKYQGSSGNTTMQAGNRFSLNHNGYQYSDYSTIKDGPITYYHHDPALSNEPRVKPEYISKYISRINQYTIFDKLVSCISHLSGGGGGGTGTGREELLAEMNENEFKSDSTGAILEALVDGGNSELLEQEVLQSMPPEAYDLYMSLIGKSPYLSDSVLVAAIEKENVLVNVLIKDVLVANPQSAKSPEVMEKVEEKTNPFNEQLLAQVLLGNYYTAAKENLEAMKAQYGQNRSIALNYLKQSYLNDTVNASAMDSLVYLLQSEEGLQEKYELAVTLAGSGNYTAAYGLLNGIPGQYDLNNYDQESYNDFMVFYNVMHELHQSGDGLDSLTLEQKTVLYDLADNSLNIAGAYARGILKQTDDYLYTEPIILPEGEVLKSSNIIFDLPGQETFIPENVNIYPNPAHEYFIVELLTGNLNGAEITIFDNKGLPIKYIAIPSKQQHFIVNIKDLATGVYIIRIDLDGRTLESKKITKLN
jgi:hypothetical protein